VRTTPWLSPAISLQRPKSLDFARFGVFPRLSQATFPTAVLANTSIFRQRSRTAAQRPVLGFRWVRARLCPENRTQP